jgi:transcriptional regulator with XRE-family HTH domain
MLVIDWKAFGERVHIARRRLQLSQSALAERVGISRNYVSMIERGVADPSYAIVAAMCEYLHIDLPPKQG